MLAFDLLPNEYSVFNATYINAAENKTLLQGLLDGLPQLVNFLKEIPSEKLEYRYAEGKWTIKDIILHMADTERIFAYRALRFARNDKTALPGFEENDYAAIAPAEERSIMSLLTEFSAIRHANILMFKSFSEVELLRIGTASENEMSVRALGFVIIGHQNHHQRIFEEMYL